ncbi:peptidoglycan-binding domain-containing protein [Streptomyces sp. NPDC004031]
MTTTPPRRRTARRLAVPLTAAAIALGVATATATPAAASNSYNGHLYIEGSGTPGDDLNDEGAVNTTTNTVSTVTCFWQNILYVDNYLPITGIDGSFGPQTKAATIKWQNDHGLTGDGSAGKATFAAAQAKFNKNFHWETTTNGMYWIGIRQADQGSADLEISRPFDGGTWSFVNRRTGKTVNTAYNINLC